MTVNKNEVAIRKRLKELKAYRDDNDKGLTHQAMADKLNAEAIPSLSGKPWSKYSVRHLLRKLDQPTSNKNQADVAAPKTAVKAIKKSPVEQTGEVTEEVVEHKLKATSPLMRWNYHESIRDIVEGLMKEHESVKTLVKKLNKLGVPTADGALWNEAAVSRVVKALQPSTSTQLNASDDVIRERIKEGWYNTEEEHFICVRQKSKKTCKKIKKSKPSKKTDKKKKKDRKGNKKKKK